MFENRLSLRNKRSTVLAFVGGLLGIGCWFVISSFSRKSIDYSKEAQLETASGSNSRVHHQLNENGNSLDKTKNVSRGGKIRDMSPSEAKPLLDKARSIPNVILRTNACVDVIERLCLSGHLEEAWAMIEESSGQVRSSELSKFFQTANLSPQELARKIVSLPYKDEASTALWGHLFPLNSVKLSQLLQNATFKDLIKKLDIENPGILKETLASCLLGRVSFPGDAGEKIKAAELAQDYHAKGLIDDNGFSQILNEDGNKDAFQKWELIADLEPSSGYSETNQLRRETIEAMIESNAPDALSKFIKKTGDHSIGDLFLGLKKWGTLDSGAANQWFLDNKNRLSSGQRDGAATAFYNLSMEYHEPAVAEQWANQIVDPALKKEALGRLTNKPKPAP